MAYLVVSSTLRPDSSTLLMARHVAGAIAQLGQAADLLDLAGVTMPWCDGVNCYQDGTTKALAERVSAATGVVVCTPIYNYTVNAGLKNFIELTDKAWEGKVVGFACSAGGPGSYMAVMQAANWLMLDHRCVVVPRFVYATREAFANGAVADAEVVRRLDELAGEVVRIGAALG
ncbi:MAG TPA: NAD(P)H-dependent oxidoreductase [Tepidisphaeraceae bacterium]|nr:NAD(P)H-dependent oxidoreductase [Tepidisphaeraceae bacterium]